MLFSPALLCCHRPTKEAFLWAFFLLVALGLTFSLTIIKPLYLDFQTVEITETKGVAQQHQRNCVESNAAESINSDDDASTTSIWNATIASSYSLLRDLLSQQRQAMETELRSDDKYGSYYSSLFYEGQDAGNRTSRGMLAATPSRSQKSQGWRSLVQRLQLKILAVQEQVLRWQEEQQGMTSARTATRRSTSSMNEQECPQIQQRRPQVPWIWAVSGHSSSAGHGNFLEQSYSNVMKETMAPLFAALGISVEIRNYGMSAHSSVPELALCMESIYGTDVDVLVWDAALTDAQHNWYMDYWMHRGAIHSNQPILVAAHVGDARMKRGKHLLMTNQYWPMIVMQEDIVRKMESKVPSALGKNGSSLPSLLKLLKCTEDDDSEILEANEPCRSFAFDLSDCKERRWMVPWHPGFRRLALYGTLLALMHADALDEALQNLQEREELVRKANTMSTTTMRKTVWWSKLRPTKNTPTRVPMSPLALVRKLKAILETERAETNVLFRAISVNTTTDSSKMDWGEIFPGIPLDWLAHSPSLCRTARLPSQQRYKGILTGAPVPYEDEMRLVPLEGIEHKYIVRHSAAAKREAITNHTTHDFDFAIGYDGNSRKVVRGCNRSIAIDFSDYFYVTAQDWRRAILPSEAEVEEYGRKQYRGVIIFCPLRCEKQTRLCSGDELVDNWSRLEFQVNGIQAFANSSMPFINPDCGILNHEEDSSSSSSNFVFDPRPDGTWEFKVRIKQQGSGDDNRRGQLFQINSIVLL